MLRNLVKEGAAAALLAFCALAASYGAARATVVRYMPLEEQVSTARVIALARAVDQRSFWDSGQNFIWTETTFEVQEGVKGAGGGTVTLRQLGGRVGEIAQAVAGTPQVVPGRQYIIFLEPRKDGSNRVVGFSQGCYPVATDNKGKARVMPRMSATGEVHYVGSGEEGEAAAQTVAEFLNRVRAHLGARQGGE